MTQKKLIFLYPTQFLKKDFDRFGINFFLKKKLPIEIWNLTPFLNRNYYSLTKELLDLENNIEGFKIREFSQKNEIISSLSEENTNTIYFVFLDPNSLTRFIFNILSNRNLNWGFVQMSSYPTSQINFKNKLKLALKSPKMTVKKIVNIFEKIFVRQKLFYPKFIILGGTLSASAQNFNANKKTRIINTHQFNFDKYLEFKDKGFFDSQVPQFSYLVYIDEMVPYHLDNYHLGINIPNCEEQVYYKEINQLFKNIEYQTGKKVIILGYQKAKNLKINRDELFGNRKIIYDKTNELVKHCDCVIMHNSTAVSFPVIYKKPIIFVTSNNYIPTYNASITSLAYELGQDPLNISEPNSFNYICDINQTKYKQFYRKFINNKDDFKELKSYEIIYKELLS